MFWLVRGAEWLFSIVHFYRGWRMRCFGFDQAV